MEGLPKTIVLPNGQVGCRRSRGLQLTLTTIFVVIPLQVAVIGRLTFHAESMAFGNSSEQRRYMALIGRCLLWLISAIASGDLLGSVAQAFVTGRLAPP